MDEKGGIGMAVNGLLPPPPQGIVSSDLRQLIR